jgi:nitrogen fixation/metabolism regulation signal transduction histidine kinase
MTTASRPPPQASPAASPAQAPGSPAGRVKYKRSFRNYIIDSRFQLKYTSFILIAAVTISAVLGIFLWRTSGEVVAESQKVVEQSKKVSDVVKMSITDDPVYADNPALAKEFTNASTEQDKKIQAQQDALVRQQRTMLFTLVGALAVMVFVIGVLGIYFTHKVAGPIYKMKLLLKQVADGRLNVNSKLRKGDELQDFFDVFAGMIENLRARKASEVALLDAAMLEAKRFGAGDDVLAVFGKVRDDLKRPLDA